MLVIPSRANGEGPHTRYGAFFRLKGGGISDCEVGAPLMVAVPSAQLGMTDGRRSLVRAVKLRLVSCLRHFCADAS